MKIGILKFLAFNIYKCEEILLHFIIGSSDTRYAVVNAAELHIKRIVGSVDFNDAIIVKMLFHAFLGDKPLQNATQVFNMRVFISFWSGDSPQFGHFEN
jgi:hypothetical protein